MGYSTSYIPPLTYQPLPYQPLPTNLFPYQALTYQALTYHVSVHPEFIRESPGGIQPRFSRAEMSWNEGRGVIYDSPLLESPHSSTSHDLQLAPITLQPPPPITSHQSPLINSSHHLVSTVINCNQSPVANHPINCQGVEAAPRQPPACGGHSVSFSLSHASHMSHAPIAPTCHTRQVFPRIPLRD